MSARQGHFRWAIESRTFGREVNCKIWCEVPAGRGFHVLEHRDGFVRDGRGARCQIGDFKDEMILIREQIAAKHPETADWPWLSPLP